MGNFFFYFIKIFNLPIDPSGSKISLDIKDIKTITTPNLKNGKIKSKIDIPIERKAKISLLILNLWIVRITEIKEAKGGESAITIGREYMIKIKAFKKGT